MDMTPHHWKVKSMTRLYALEIILILILNIALLLGIQMIFIYGGDPAQDFTVTPIDTVQVEHSSRHPSRDIQVTAYLLPTAAADTDLVIVERHPWFNRYRTVKNHHHWGR